MCPGAQFTRMVVTQPPARGPVGWRSSPFAWSASRPRPARSSPGVFGVKFKQFMSSLNKLMYHCSICMLLFILCFVLLIVLFVLLFCFVYTPEEFQEDGDEEVGEHEVGEDEDEDVVDHRQEPARAVRAALHVREHDVRPCLAGPEVENL